jgi:hypothetical protein
LRGGQRPVLPLHWELEFPEVFGATNPGFDVVAGNPPFLGGTRMSSVMGMQYFQFLGGAFPPCEHHCDLVAYFFRRAFSLLRNGGTLGLIATNTVSQGDTREGGLREILQSGGRIYTALRRYRWPGPVAVVVSVVHVAKRITVSPSILDGKEVKRISAYLVNGQNDDSPARLSENPYFSLGSKIYGQGFLFADGDPECSPLIERDRILAKRPEYESRIRPYIGGSDILAHPRQMSDRYVILLTDLEREEDLAQYPELERIVREKVKPERDVLGSNPNNAPLKRRWWAFQAHRPELYRRLASMGRVLATSNVNPHLAFALIPSNSVYSQKVILFAIDGHSGFCVVQSRVHQLWARSFGSTSMELMSYTPSDCFETFPFPAGWQTDPHIEAAGQACYEFRAALMVRNDQGLTDTYNRFHDPNERDSEILHLRELHGAMDHAVLQAYGWTNIPTDCGFFLDYEIDEETWGDKKKPYRYRWPDVVHDEVLARLLDLNQKRYQEEAAAGLHGKLDAAAPGARAKTKASGNSPKAAPKPKVRPPNQTLALFSRDEENDS